MTRLSTAFSAPFGGYLTLSGRAGVWRDLVQVFGGKLALRLPTSVIGVAHFRFAFPPDTVPVRGSRGVCPARSSTARPVSN